MLHPPNVATPLVTVAGALVQVSAAVESPPVNPSVTPVVLSVSTTFPRESSTDTTGWLAKAKPGAAALLGWVAKASWLGVPA